jgi:hypothetical protein
MIWPLIAMLAASAAKSYNDTQREKRDRKRDRALARTAPFGGMQPQGIREADPLGTMLGGAISGAQMSSFGDGESGAGDSQAGDLTKPPGNQTSPWVDMSGSGYLNAAGDVAPQTTQQLPDGTTGQVPMDYGDHIYKDIFKDRTPVAPEMSEDLLNGATPASPSVNTQMAQDPNAVIAPPTYAGEATANQAERQFSPQEVADMQRRGLWRGNSAWERMR